MKELITERVPITEKAVDYGKLKFRKSWELNDVAV
jgi:hypothetical protein